MDLNIRIAGEAGQGVHTTGALLAGVFASLGLHLLVNQSYMSRIRGGLNWVDLRVSDTELFGPRETVDLLVALTPQAREVLAPTLADGGLTLFDGAEHGQAVGIAFSQTAKELAKSAVMANAVAAGAVFTALGYPLDALLGYLSTQFARKGAEVVDANIACARRGAELAAEVAGRLAAPRPAGAPEHLVMGADATGLGAATAGVKLVTAYPMTPGTATFTALAALADKFDITVEQAEDEIAAINMACGGAYAGAPTLVPTSGGGFALMVEGLSLAGMMELPVVVLLAQRPGPATGLPTRTGQEDLLFTLHAGHGEFPRAIFAPGTIEQCFSLTRRAIEQAHKFQTPAVILTDQYLQDLSKNIEPLNEFAPPVDRHILENAPADYRRYVVTAGGVSPRAIPGGQARVVMDSDEHTEDGHLTERLEVHLEQHDKRMRKGDGLAADALLPEYYGPADAEHLLIAWGSTYGPCREAVDRLNDAGGSAAMLHFAQVWPITVEAVRQALANRKRVTVVEGNSTGQFKLLLREAGVFVEGDAVLRYDGMVFSAEYICNAIGKGQQ